MNEVGEVSALSAMLTATLVIGGAVMALIGSLGLLRLRSFYERAHAPTLGTTLGTACIATASMIYFSALGNRPVLHEVLIVLFVTVTTPAGLMVLVRAALLRGRSENNEEVSAQNRNPSSTRPITNELGPR